MKFNNPFKTNTNLSFHTVQKFGLLIAMVFLGFTNQSFAQSTKEFKTSTDTLVVYSDVPGLTPSEFYTIKVKSAATNDQWVECFANITRSLYSLYASNGGEGYYEYIRDWSHTYASIEMSRGSTVEVQISAKNGFKIKGSDFNVANAHPAHKASKPTVVNNVVYFTINNPSPITIDINGQMDETNTGNGYAGPAIHTISLFANPVIKKPTIGAAGVYYVAAGQTVPTNSSLYTTLYFGPGKHDIGRGFKLNSNKNYYISGDAIVYGTINNIGVGQVNNVRIYGYGTLCGDKIKHPDSDPEYAGDGTAWKMIYADKCTNFRIEGIAIANTPMHSININAIKTGKKETFCHWLKIMTWRVNGDGIGTAHETNYCFIRTQDDCSYVKGDKKGCVFWTDVNGTVFSMAGMPAATERSVLVEDCDVIYPRHCSTSWNGGRVFAKRGPQEGNNYKVNVTFRDIRIWDKYQTLETFYISSSDHQGTSGAFSGITFENITSVKPPLATHNRIVGHSGGIWDDITFDNVVLGGKAICSRADFAAMDPTYVTNVNFICGPKVPVANFTANPTSINEGGSVSFTDQSTDTPTSWAWSFPGGTPSTSTAKNPIVTYAIAGTYNVTLTATNSAGSDSEAKTAYIIVVVPAIPVAGFSGTPTPIAVGGTVKFFDQSANIPTSWSWSFPGGTPSASTVQNPTVSYATAGTYNVTLTATNSLGSSTPLTKTNYITVVDVIKESIPWNESFTYVNGTQSHGAPTTWTATGGMAVQNNEISFNTITTEGVLTTGIIDISSGPVTVSVNIRGGGGLDAGQDYLKLFKKVDGSAEVQIGFADGLVTVPSWPADINSGNTIELILRAKVSSATEYYYFDNLKVISSNGTAVIDIGSYDSNISIYPNPASDIININFNNDASKKEIKIINNLGQVVFSKNINATNTQIDVKSLNIKGIVLIQVIQNHKVSNQRVIVK